MESISVFDIFKIGVGPSSSHTMGPWRAAQRFAASLGRHGKLDQVREVEIDLYGSLAKTGKGHGTDIALLLGLCGEDAETCEVDGLVERAEATRAAEQVKLAGEYPVVLKRENLRFHMTESLPFHPNGMTLTAIFEDGTRYPDTYYSVGGGFVVQENQEEPPDRQQVQLPMPIEKSAELLDYCMENGLRINGVVRRNEAAWRPAEETEARTALIARTMIESVWRGCRTSGELPGGLKVKRRAAELAQKLLGGPVGSYDEFLAALRGKHWSFPQINNWVSCFALAVNEENAAFGRVVTAPTNGAAGVIPSVLMYLTCFTDLEDGEIAKAQEIMLLAASEVGCLFKKGATISAAMGGCQAEIGVSSAMAAAGLTEALGGAVEQSLMAAEIAMEHHLGLTCDPIGGLVQVPCIERNTMGAMKAITAAHLALESDPSSAKVSLDDVIQTMWETAQDMNSKYKETSEGGLAVRIPVLVPEC